METLGIGNSFGEKLAVLHMNKNEFFGLDYDNYIGSLRQINKKRIIGKVSIRIKDFYISQNLHSMKNC